MTVEQVSDLIKSVGLVVAGLWAAWTFYRLKKITDANLGIASKQMINEEQSRKLLSAQPQLVVQLNALEIPSPADQYKSVLSITVTLSNLGTQNLLVRFRKHTLSVAKIEIGEVGPQSIRNVQFFAPLYFDNGSDNPKQLPFRIMRVGQVRKTVLATIPVDEPCAYFIQFFASYWREPFHSEVPSKRQGSLKAAKDEEDGGPPDRKGEDVIQAIEQTFCVVTGKAGGGMAI
jgi:hypothetical protein